MKRACALLLLAACSKPAPAAVDAGTTATSTFDASVIAIAIAKAEDARRAKDIPPEARTSHDVAARRRSARALARIADASSIDGLTMHLADEDPETAMWAAYGLGYACKGREDATVRALTARAASLTSAEPARIAVARAIGRCGAPQSEDVLVGLAGNPDWIAPAFLGLGDLAVRKKQLGPAAMTALLDGAGSNDIAFYALSRAEVGSAFASRIQDVARVQLTKAGDARILAIRALGRAGNADNVKETAAELGKIVAEAKGGWNLGERAEAARAMGTMGDPGQSALADVVSALTPDSKDAVGIARIVGPDFNVVSTVLGQLGDAAPKKAEPSLQVLASLVSTDPHAPWIRCTAALALSRGAYDSDVLTKCDAQGTEAWEKARLDAVLRRPLTKDRLTAFKALAKSEHLRVREAAIDGLATHGEIADGAVGILADALTSKHAGLVATAAELLNAHPERALTLAESEKRAALDPKSPPPTANPAQEVSPLVGKALATALATPWPEDRFETRIALFEAAASVHIHGAKEAATTACNDANPVVRERALKALRTLGADVKACEAPDKAVAVAAEVANPLTKPAKIIFDTDAGKLTIVLEPELSPVTATRILSLAKSGFYKGIVVHRVVPGFVAQFGDPDGDGYGGSGTSLRCETSPVPFRPLDVGMALAGRDTGSSQMFVTLARTPHLDGEYTRVGHAEGDWEHVAQGDVIRDVTVEE